jgi:glycosyltransferase involved in cell wall biosynthesis
LLVADADGVVAPNVTVMVPVKDRRERMLRCLEALLAQDYPSYEVLVLDNRSADGTAEACRERAAAAKVPVRVEVVGGKVGQVRNAGARLATGEIIACTDSDCIPTPTWLREGVRPFEDPAVGVVTGTTLPEEDPSRRSWPATVKVTDQTWRFESCNLFLRRDPFCRTAGFQEEVERMGEDTTAGWGMVDAGWRAEFAPAALVYHDVTYPGFRWHLSRARRYGEVAAAVRRFPRLRRDLLWHRYFLWRRNARVVSAVIGVSLAPLNRKTLVLTAPYVAFLMLTPRRATPLGLLGQLKVVVLDLNILYGMVRGSLRWRTLVL